MRSIYSSVLALLFFGSVAGAAPSPGQSVPGEVTADFKVFVRGSQVGTEEVSVARTDSGTVISGSGRLNAPISLVTNRCEIRYDGQWRPVEASVDAIIRGDYMVLHTVFANGAATTQVTQAGNQTTKTDKVRPDDIVIVNSFFGVYEALTARLQAMTAGNTLNAYVLPVAEIGVELKAVTEEKIQTPARVISTRHYVVSLMNPSGPVQMELWGDETGRLVRLLIPSQAIEVAREDVATVAARRVTVTRAGDEEVKIAANGFSLAGTLSKPPSWKATDKTRYAAVLLVGGSGPADRDETLAGVPIFAQLAGSLADAGFVVLRYDKRGVGQSGGRADSATLEDYAEDARSAVKYLRSRKDVDQKRIAVAAHSEGGWVAMLAAANNKDIAALVMMGTSGLPGSDVILAQQRHSLDMMKMTPEEREAKIALQKKIQDAVMTGNGWDSIPPAMKRQADTDWFRSFLAFVPSKVMREDRQPALVIVGELDKQTLPLQAELLTQWAKGRKGAAGNESLLVRLPGLNHLLVPAQTGEMDEYPRLSAETVSPAVTTTIVDWLHDRMPAGKK